MSTYRKKQQTDQGTMWVWRTLGDNSRPDLLMASGVGSATGASWSGAILASSSTHAPRAACLVCTVQLYIAAILCYYTFLIEPRPVCCSFLHCSFLSWSPNPGLFLRAIFLGSTQRRALCSYWARSYWRAYTVVYSWVVGWLGWLGCWMVGWGVDDIK